MSSTSQRETVDDLARHDGKAELIGGRVVALMPTGVRPNEIAGNIYVSLRLFAQQSGQGRVFTDNIGYTVPELDSGRESFSPDASWYEGPLPANAMRFIEGPPTFAVEVRSENDYGSSAERELEAKRIDYFAAGTLVVWDVDPIAETVAIYLRDGGSRVVARGEVADAEPAVPGWQIDVDEIVA